MTRPLRITAPGLTYHVTGRGNSRMTIYRDDRDYGTFLAVLDEVSVDRSIDCYAFALMPNHYHLVMTTREANISSAVHDLNGRYAQWWNWRHDHAGHVFQGRFGAKVVQDGVYLLRACRYVDLNPVRARLVDAPDQWAWSSFRATVGLDPVPGFLRPQVLWSAVQGEGATEGQQKYREFVACPDDDVKALLTEAVFGDAAFVAGFKQWREQASSEVPLRERDARAPIDTLFANAATLQARREAVKRALAMGYKGRDIAQRLGVHYTTVFRMRQQAGPRRAKRYSFRPDPS